MPGAELRLLLGLAVPGHRPRVTGRLTGKCHCQRSKPLAANARGRAPPAARIGGPGPPAAGHWQAHWQVPLPEIEAASCQCQGPSSACCSDCGAGRGWSDARRRRRAPSIRPPESGRPLLLPANFKLNLKHHDASAPGRLPMTRIPRHAGQGFLGPGPGPSFNKAASSRGRPAQCQRPTGRPGP